MPVVPVVPVSSFADNEWMVIIGVILIVLQFLYRLWDKKDSAATIGAITKAVKAFEPNAEINKRTFGIVRDLKRLHDVRDEDGRPMWYMPHEIIQTQRELVKLSTILATTQEQLVRLMDRMEVKIDDHKNECKNQFNHLDKRINIT